MMATDDDERVRLQIPNASRVMLEGKSSDGFDEADPMVQVGPSVDEHLEALITEGDRQRAREQAVREFEEWWLSNLGEPVFEPVFKHYARMFGERGRAHDAMRDAWLKSRGFAL